MRLANGDDHLIWRIGIITLDGYDYRCVRQLEMAECQAIEQAIAGIIAGQQQPQPPPAELDAELYAAIDALEAADTAITAALNAGELGEDATLYARSAQTAMDAAAAAANNLAAQIA